jgi:chromosome segregation ATPase
MPKPTTPISFAGHLRSLQESLASLEGKINTLKGERDAHVHKHRAVYETERKYADKIKALQTEVTPIWSELKELRDLIAGKV